MNADFNRGEYEHMESKSVAAAVALLVVILVITVIIAAAATLIFTSNPGYNPLAFDVHPAIFAVGFLLFEWAVLAFLVKIT